MFSTAISAAEEMEGQQELATYPMPRECKSKTVVNLQQFGLDVSTDWTELVASVAGLYLTSSFQLLHATSRMLRRARWRISQYITQRGSARRYDARFIFPTSLTAPLISGHWGRVVVLDWWQCTAQHSCHSCCFTARESPSPARA